MRRMRLQDPASIRDMLRHAVADSSDPHLVHQLHCLVLVAMGHSCHVVAGWFGDSTRTVQRWVRAFDHFGASSLHGSHAAGRPPKLTESMRQRLESELRLPPNRFDYTAECWSGVLLARHLQVHYGVTLGLRQCQRLCRRS